MKKIPKILVLVETSREYARGILSGLAQYSQIHGPWMFISSLPFYLKTPGDQTSFSGIDTLGIDGIILQARYITDQIRKLGVPLIALDANTDLKDIPQISTNDRRIGRIAAEHLTERGFSHYAFCGYDHLGWSQRRCESFQETVEDAGHHCYIYTQPKQAPPQFWAQEYLAIIKWLDTLPRPLGLMASNDDRGQYILEACKVAGYAIPEEIAVVGADDDQLKCRFTAPPLSSVSLNLEKAGYQAAELMDKLLHGQPAHDIRVDPKWVVCRQSTDIIAVEDADVSQALRFIREHGTGVIQVSDVVQALCISRRTLYSKFSKALGRSVHDEIVRVRLERVHTLLTDTKLSISRIAEMMGFAGPDKLYRFFIRETGKTPTEFRKEIQGYRLDP
ncbi:MAG: substrate-binding domain-containing protein [Planctomycetes bacterium]|nr:substrate-binding domain-containing protein [Planctomycetota bacterium]